MSKLKDVAEIRGRVGWKGYTVNDLTKSGPLVVGANDINDDNQLDLSNVKHLTRQKYEESPEIFLQKNDLLVVKVGSTIGKSTIIDQDIGEASINPNCVIVRPTKIDPYFLYCFLTSPNGKKYLLNNSSASAQPALNQKDLGELPIPDFSFDDQTKISNIFKLINHKIFNNIQINKLYESMIKTIYDYWFLQFEFPNKQNKPYKSSGGKMVYNEELKREIPEGWEVATLVNSSICSDIKPGVQKFKKKKYLPTSNIDLDSFNDGDWTTYEKRENRANMEPIQYSVWFAKMKKTIKHISIPKNSHWFTDAYILSTGFQGIKCSENSFAFIHSLINSDWFEKKKDSLAHGATQEGVNNKDLLNIKFPVPNSNILAKFSNLINNILEEKFNLLYENQQLLSIKEFLLPLLMSKQIGF